MHFVSESDKISPVFALFLNFKQCKFGCRGLPPATKEKET